MVVTFTQVCRIKTLSLRSPSRTEGLFAAFGRRKALVLLTDGEDSASKISLAEAISSCERAETLAYSVRIARPGFRDLSSRDFPVPAGKPTARRPTLTAYGVLARLAMPAGGIERISNPSCGSRTHTTDAGFRRSC